MRLSWDLWMCIGCKASPWLFKNGSLAEGVGDCKFHAPLPSQRCLLMPLGGGVYPAGGCRMRPKSLPDANKTLAAVQPQLSSWALLSSGRDSSGCH